jgi:hypothetical protein
MQDVQNEFGEFTTVEMPYIFEAGQLQSPEGSDQNFAVELLEDGNISRHWYTWLRSQRARDVDPDRVFTAEGSTLKVSGTDMGCVTTREAFRDYRLTLEFRYVDNDRQLNKTAARDGGILFHSTGTSKSLLKLS